MQHQAVGKSSINPINVVIINSTNGLIIFVGAFVLTTRILTTGNKIKKRRKERGYAKVRVRLPNFSSLTFLPKI